MPLKSGVNGTCLIRIDNGCILSCSSESSQSVEGNFADRLGATFMPDSGISCSNQARNPDADRAIPIEDSLRSLSVDLGLLRLTLLALLATI